MKVATTRYPKGWGHELWIHNDEQYCGKLLSFDARKRCSFHYHIEKTETFFLRSGRIDVISCDRASLKQYFQVDELGSIAPTVPPVAIALHLVAYVVRNIVPPKPFNVTTLLPCDAFEVPRDLVHQMIAREQSELFEFSTQHFEHDSYRIVKGD